MDSELISVRIPAQLLDKIDRIAREQYPSRTGKKPNRSQVILDALEKMNGSDKLSKLEARITALEKWRDEQIAAVELETVTPGPTVASDSVQNQPPLATPDRIGLTHAELARLLKVSPATISRWANGKRTPPKDLKYKFDPTSKLWKPY